MKTIKLYLAACLLIITTAVSAQFANSNSSPLMSKSSGTTDTNGWSRIFVSYNPMNIVFDYENADDLSVTGFSFGYTKGVSIAKEFPLFIEFGVNGLYGLKKEEEEEIETKLTFFSLNVPVNLAYKYSIPNSNVTIVPYIGVNFRGNIIGKQKLSYNGDLGDFSESELWEAMEEKYGIKQESNMFDKDDVGKDAQWKRIQMGWQIGVGFNYNKLYLGVGYGKDFTELCKKTKIGVTSITLGYNL